MKKIRFTDFISSLKTLAVRFLFPVIMLLGIAVLFLIEINYSDANTPEKWWAFLWVGIPLSISFSLFAEDFKNILSRIIIPAGVLLLFGIYVLFLPEKLPDFLVYQLIAIAGSATMASVVISFYRKNDAVASWEFSKNIVKQISISYVFSMVLMLGLSLAVVSLQELFKIHIQSEVYQNLAVFCFVIFAPFYFLSNIPAGVEKFKTELKSDKFIKILGLYILLPILLVYVAILYVYLIQIVATWELPNGWVSWLVTALAMAGFVTLMCQYPLRNQKNKVAEYFACYFPVILLPLLILMSVGIFRRIADYGWTINRMYVFIFNIWLYGITIYLLISQSKYLKYIVSSFALITFLSSVGPWSVFAVTKHILFTETQEILNSNEYLGNGKVKPLAEIKVLSVDEKQKGILSEKIKYLTENYGSISLQSFFVVDINTKSYGEICELLNINYANNYFNAEKYYNYYLKDNSESIDIQLYSQMIRLNVFDNNAKIKNSVVEFNSKENQLTIVKDGMTYQIFLNAILQKLADLPQNDPLPASSLTIKTANFTLLIENINFRKETADSQFIINQLQGWVMY